MELPEKVDHQKDYMELPEVKGNLGVVLYNAEITGKILGILIRV